MIRKMTLVILMAFLFTAISAHAQVRKQVFWGSGVNTAWATGAHSTATVAGFALIVPVSKTIFLRPVVAAGEVNPQGAARPFRIFQGGCLVGYRMTGRFAVLAGGAETVQMLHSGTVYLPTAIVSTATRIGEHWGIYTPVTATKRGWGALLQTGVTW